MPLDKQTVSMPFVQGPDTKQDPRLSAKPSRLENACFTSGDLNKRNGRKQLPSAIDTGGSQSVGEALFARNGELVRINGGATYGLSPTSSVWLTKAGGNNYCTLSKTQLIRNTRSQLNYDHASAGGVGVLAWTESGGTNPGLHIAVYDIASGTFYQAGTTAIAATAEEVPRCLVLGNTVVVICGNRTTGTLKSTVVSAATPSAAIAALATIKSDYYASAATFDAFTYNSTYGVVVYPRSGTSLGVFAISAAGAVLASPADTTIAAVTGAAGLAQAGVFAQRDTAGNIYIVIGDTQALRTRFLVRSSTFAAVVAVTDIVTTGNWSGNAISSMAAATSVELTTNNLTIIMTSFANFSGSSTVQTWLGKVVLGSAGIVTAFSEVPSTQGMWITGDLAAYDGTYVLGAINIPFPISGTLFTGTQTGAYFLSPTGVLVAKGLASLSGLAASASLAAFRVCRSLSSSTSAAQLFSEQGRTAFEGAANLPVTPLGISKLTVTKTTPAILGALQLGNTVYVGGGVPRTYDGVALVETGFQLFPDEVGITAGGVGSLSSGSYQYKFLWSWINATGELVRGITSTPSTVAVTAGQAVALSIATLPISVRDVLPAGATVAVEVYRTIANGTTFYRLPGSVSSPTLNATTYAGTTAGSIAVADTFSDAELQNGELLYTNGGILDWEPPPAYIAASVHGQRLVVLPSEDTSSFVPSSQWVTGEQLRFSSFNKGYVPAESGPLTGCASMDGKLFLLTQAAAYVTLGNGPDNLGNNQYPPPQLVVGVDAGPLPASPVVTTPLGIIYQSVKGLTLIDRALNQQFIGADVEAFTIGPWVLRSILVHPRLQQIHFQVDDGRDIPGAEFGTLVTSNGGYRLVYDYFQSQWSMDPNCGAQDACLYQGNYTQVRSDGVVWQETPGLYLDNGAAYSSLVETPWIKLAGLQGFQRLYYMELLGTYGSDFTLTLDVAYSYAETSPSVPSYDSADTVTLNGAGVFAAGGTFSIRHHLGKKCSAVKFRIREVNVRGSGLGMGLSDLSLEYGVKKGLLKLPAAQTA